MGDRMEKVLTYYIRVLLFICVLLISTLFVVKDNGNTSKVTDTDVFKETIDVSKNLEPIIDYEETKVLSEIDIANLVYTEEEISILGTDFVISESLLNNLYELINSYGASCSFYMLGLNDGMSIGYNVDKVYETASSIKASYALYIYREIDKGNINHLEKLVYEEWFYNEGTGEIKNSEYGVEYSILDLVYYSLNDSDNIAHTMLHNRFGVDGYNKMLRNLKTKQLYLSASSPWGFTSARSAAIIWQDIYNFSLESSKGVELLNILSNGKYNYFKEILPHMKSASKTGFAKKDVVETGIVFGKQPYIAIAMANKGGNIGAYTQVLKLVNAMNDIMNEYIKYSKD